MRKCLKIAAQCVDLNAQFELHVEILNYFLFYFEAKNENVRDILSLFLICNYLYISTIKKDHVGCFERAHFKNQVRFEQSGEKL